MASTHTTGSEPSQHRGMAVPTTFSDLVKAIQDGARSDDEAVAVITHMLRTRRIRLGRERRGRRIQVGH